MRIYIHSPTIGSVALPSQVFGGPQAVEFSAGLHEFAENGGLCVVVDLSNVELMNSSGLGMLVSGLTSMRKYGGTLKLAIVPNKIEHLLKITRLDTVFELYLSVEKAISSFQ